MTYNELDWFLAKTVDRSYILTLPATVDIPNNYYEAYDPINNTYSFVFYNDGLYIPLPVLDTDEPYDAVPLEAGSLEVANGNVVLLGDILQGYNTPPVQAKLSVNYIDKRSSVNIPTQVAPLKYTGQNEVIGVTHAHKNGVYILHFTGTARVGDIITVTTIDGTDGFKNIYSYTVEQSLDGNTLGVIQKLAAMFRLGASVKLINGEVQMLFTSEANQGFLSTIIQLANVGTGFTVAIPALKSNSSYQAALVFYNKYGIFCPPYTDAGMIVKTKSLAAADGAIPVISWTLTGIPPPWAVSYQWVLTKNTTHATTLYVNAKLYKDDANYLQFYINSLKIFNKTNNSSVLNYDYSVGDRVTFQYWEDSTTKHYYDSPSFDTEVVAFDPAFQTVADDPSTQYINEQKLDFILKVRRPSAMNIGDITGKNVLLEIYSPAKSLLATDHPFFETGERFDIVNGQYAVTAGSITDGDVFYKTREMVSETDEQSLETVFVEEFNYSDYYPSRYTSYGRPHQYLKSAGQVRLKACIRNGQKYVKGNRVNLINRFFAADIYGLGDGETKERAGAIVVMAQFANMLRCLQEFDVCYIPVNLSILEDQVEQQNVAISERFLNKAQYSQAAQVGIGFAKSTYAENRRKQACYFIDPNRSDIFRVGADGLISIAGKMGKFFRKTLQEAYSNKRVIIGYYDDFYDEYTVSIQQDDVQVASIAFSGLNWKTLEDYTVLPRDITITNPTDATVVYDSTTGMATYQTSAPGSHNFLFTFNVNGLPVTKRVCILADGGITAIAPFAFVALVNEPLSALLASNFVIITGNTVPVPISITGGQYSFGDSGVWASLPGLVNPNTSVKVRQTSSATGSTLTSAVLTVGGYSASFDVTTAPVAPAKFILNVTEQGNVNSATPPYADTNGLIKDNGNQVSARQVNTGTNTSYVQAGHTGLALAFVEFTSTGANAIMVMNIHKNGQQVQGWPQQVAVVAGNTMTYQDVVASNDVYIIDIVSTADPAPTPQN